jgi:WD40 repeat protein
MEVVMGQRTFQLALSAILTVLSAVAANEPTAGAARDLHGDPLPPGAIARLGTLRFRTADWITHIAFSRDGKRLVTQSPTAVATWNAESGEKLVEFTDKRIGPVAWRADGRGIMLVQDATGAVHFGNIARDTLLMPPAVEDDSPSYEKQFEENAISPDGKYVVAKYTEKQVLTVWELEPGKLLSQLRPVYIMGHLLLSGGLPGRFRHIVFSPDSAHFGILCTPTPGRGPPSLQFALYDLPTGRERARCAVPMPNGNGRQLTVALALGGRYLAVGGEDNICRVIDLNREGLEVPLEVGGKNGWTYANWTSVAFADDKVFAFSGNDRCLHVHDVKTGRAVRPPVRVADFIEAMSLSPDGKRMAPAGRGGVIRLWDASSGREMMPPAGHVGTIEQVQIIAGGAKAITADSAGVQRLWEVATGKELRRFDVSAPSHQFTITPDEKAIIAIISEELRVFDLSTGSALASPPQMSQVTGRLQVQPEEGQSVIVDDGDVGIWRWPEGRLRQRIELGKSHRTWQAREYSLAPDGKILAARNGNTLDLWNLDTGARFAQLQDDLMDDHRGIAFLDYGRNLALMGSKGTGHNERSKSRLSLWDLRDCKPIREFEPPGSRLSRALAADPRGYLLATAEEGDKGFTLIYEVASGKIRRRLAGHFHVNTFVGFTPDGNRLVTAGGDSTCLIWDLTLAAAARARTPNSITNLERAWNVLAEADAAAAYDAMVGLVSHSDRATDFLRTRVRAMAHLDDATLDRLVADLGSEQFATRQRAEVDLDKLGRSAVPAMLARAANIESLETKRRLERFLQRHESGPLPPEELRAVRSLEILESIGTLAARAVIAELAKGEPTAELTIRARAAQQRLDRRAS